MQCDNVFYYKGGVRVRCEGEARHLLTYQPSDLKSALCDSCESRLPAFIRAQTIKTTLTQKDVDYFRRLRGG